MIPRALYRNNINSMVWSLCNYACYYKRFKEKLNDCVNDIFEYNEASGINKENDIIMYDGDEEKYDEETITRAKRIYYQIIQLVKDKIIKWEGCPNPSRGTPEEIEKIINKFNDEIEEIIRTG